MNNNNNDVGEEIGKDIEGKAKNKLQGGIYKVASSSIDTLKHNRKMKIHKNSIDEVQNLNKEINNSTQQSNFENNTSSSLDKKFDKNNEKINKIDSQREELLYKRQEQLANNPVLKSSLNHLDWNGEAKLQQTSNSNPIQNKQSTSQYKRSEQKKYSQYNSKDYYQSNNNDIEINKNREINNNDKNNDKYELSIKELDLDNDGVPDRIDADDTRSVIKIESDKSLVGNRTDKYQDNNQYNQNSYSTDNSSFKTQKEVNQKIMRSDVTSVNNSNKNINISEVDKNIKFDKSFSTNEENVNTFTKNLLVNPISSFYPNHSSFENNNISENKNNINFSQSNQSNQTMQSTSKYKKSEQKKYSQNNEKNYYQSNNNNNISVFNNKEKSYTNNINYNQSKREFDLDNDGVTDRIDPDDTRSVIRVQSDNSLVGNRNDKYQDSNQNKSLFKSQKEVNQKIMRNGVAFENNIESNKNMQFTKQFSSNRENVNTFTKNLLVNPISDSSTKQFNINSENKKQNLFKGQKELNQKKMRSVFTSENNSDFRISNSQRELKFTSPLLNKSDISNSFSKSLLLNPLEREKNLFKGQKELNQKKMRSVFNFENDKEINSRFKISKLEKELKFSNPLILDNNDVSKSFSKSLLLNPIDKQKNLFKKQKEINHKIIKNNFRFESNLNNNKNVNISKQRPKIKFNNQFILNNSGKSIISKGLVLTPINKVEGKKLLRKEGQNIINKVSFTSSNKTLFKIDKNIEMNDSKKSKQIKKIMVSNSLISMAKNKPSQVLHFGKSATLSKKTLEFANNKKETKKILLNNKDKIKRKINIHQKKNLENSKLKNSKIKIKDKNKQLSKLKQKRKNIVNSQLTSSMVGKRTITQKVIMSPTNILSTAGGTFKRSLNKDFEESDVDGIQFANSIISPLARKIKFESTSLISRKVGFDRKAYNLSKVEKKIMIKDKKMLRVKKAQRKMIRKKATLNAKTLQVNKASLLNRVREMKLSSVFDIKNKFLEKIYQMFKAVKNIKGLFIIALISLAILIPVFVIVPIVSMITSGIVSISQNKQNDVNLSASSLSPDVMKWEGKVLEELKKYGLEKYKDLALIIIHLESRGNVPDVMQSSESIGLAPNTITDPNYSIEVGIVHLKKGIELMNKSNVDIQTLIHSYNYGNGFVGYVSNNGGKWTQELANNFSNIQASKLGWSSYGDKSYVEKAMKFLTISDDEVNLDTGTFLPDGATSFPAPSHTRVSSPFGWRVHPIFGTRKLHTGTDFPTPMGTPIVAVRNGVVSRASSMGGYGNAVMIDHGGGVTTLYAHNSSLTVSQGQTVSAGQVIAKAGSTGYSTGPHCHFEVRQNGGFIDPMTWLRK